MTYCRAISLRPFSRFFLTELSTFDRLLFLGFQLPGYSQRFLDYLIIIHLLVVVFIVIVIVVGIYKPI